MRGIHRSPVNSPHKSQWRGALMFSLICAWINGWVNNEEAGDLRRYCADYDVTVMRQMRESVNIFHLTLKIQPMLKWPGLSLVTENNGLSPVWHQAIIWTNTDSTVNWTPGTKFSEIVIKIWTFSFKDMQFKCRLQKIRHFVPTCRVQWVNIWAISPSDIDTWEGALRMTNCLDKNMAPA